MANTQRVLILTGGRADTDCVLRGHRFVKGRAAIVGNEGSIGGIVRYMGRVYKAFSEGSPELKFWQEVDNGKREHPKDAIVGSAESFRSDLRPIGKETAEDNPDTGKSTVDPNSGGEGSVPNGNRHQNPGNDGQKQQPNRIQEALNSLDSSNDEHWTADGRPRMDAVEAAYGSSDITRANVDEVAPGFMRNK